MSSKVKSQPYFNTISDLEKESHTLNTSIESAYENWFSFDSMQFVILSQGYTAVITPVLE